MNERCIMIEIIKELNLLPNDLIYIICHLAIMSGHERLIKLLKSEQNTLRITHEQNCDLLVLTFNNQKSIFVQTRIYGIFCNNQSLSTTKITRILENKMWPKNAHHLWTVLHQKWTTFFCDSAAKKKVK